jgi:hypothetical protein
MPPTNFFGSLGNTNLFRRHGHISGLFLNFADDTNVPGGARLPREVHTVSRLCNLSKDRRRPLLSPVSG